MIVDGSFVGLKHCFQIKLRHFISLTDATISQTQIAQLIWIDLCSVIWSEPNSHRKLFIFKPTAMFSASHHPLQVYLVYKTLGALKQEPVCSTVWCLAPCTGCLRLQSHLCKHNFEDWGSQRGTLECHNVSHSTFSPRLTLDKQGRAVNNVLERTMKGTQKRDAEDRKTSNWRRQRAKQRSHSLGWLRNALAVNEGEAGMYVSEADRGREELMKCGCTNEMALQVRSRSNPDHFFRLNPISKSPQFGGHTRETQSHSDVCIHGWLLQSGSPAPTVDVEFWPSKKLSKTLNTTFHNVLLLLVFR